MAGCIGGSCRMPCRPDGMTQGHACIGDEQPESGDDDPECYCVTPSRRRRARAEPALRRFSCPPNERCWDVGDGNGSAPTVLKRTAPLKETNARLGSFATRDNVSSPAGAPRMINAAEPDHIGYCIPVLTQMTTGKLTRACVWTR